MRRNEFAEWMNASPWGKPPKRYTKSVGGAHLIRDTGSVIYMGFQRKRELPDPASLDPMRLNYSALELEDYAEAILRKDAKETRGIGVYPNILFEEHLYNRRRREILVESGVPDAVITAGLSKDGQTLYNRTHPQGRKVNSPEQRRRNGAAYYRLREESPSEYDLISIGEHLHNDYGDEQF